MKTQIKFFGILTAIIISVCTIFISCEKEDVNNVVTYIGKVVYANTTTPFADCLVQVTDGNNIHCQGFTDASGAFSLQVRVNDINGDYYLLAGDATCVPKKVSLGGYGQAQVDLGTIEVEGPSLPVVTTKPASNIGDNSATSGGNVLSDGRMEVIARGVCWSKKEYPTTDDEHTVNGAGLGEFSSKLTGLETDALYYVRAYATNKQGTAYGEQITITTTSGLPRVTTVQVINITATTAVCEGNVTDNGGYAITARGICWSNTSASPTISDQHTTEVATTGSFTSMMIGLEPNKKYYARAYAVNEKGTNYGTTLAFTTLSGVPIVETIDPGENITSSSITAVGNVTDDCGFAVTERGVVYSTLPYPTLDNSSKVTSGSGTGYFSATISNITPAKKNYYIRAYAINSKGISYGDQVIITTDRYDYLSLKTMVYGGYTYKIQSLGKMSWTDGNTNCENMVYGGYDDWFMPNVGEVRAIIDQVYKLSGYYSYSADLEIEGSKYIWTSTAYNTSCGHDHFHISYYQGDGYCWIKWGDCQDSALYLVFAVRKYRTEN